MNTHEIDQKLTTNASKETGLDHLTVWQSAAPSLLFDIRGVEGEIILSPHNETQLPNNPEYLTGTFDGEAFHLSFDTMFFEALFLEIASNTSIAALSPQDVPLVIEHIFTPYFEQLESQLGGKLAFISFNQTCDVQDNQQFDFTIHSMSNVYEGKLFTNSTRLMTKLSLALMPYQVIGEKDCSIVSDVVIGPIVLNQADIASIAIGDLISIGQNPDQNLEGYIKRPNGTSWQAMLSGSSAIISSAKNSFDELFKPVDGCDLLGLKIGTINISANKTLHIKKDDTVPIERLAENAVHLVTQDQTIASGVLQTSGGHLCIEISHLESNHGLK